MSGSAKSEAAQALFLTAQGLALGLGSALVVVLGKPRAVVSELAPATALVEASGLVTTQG